MKTEIDSLQPKVTVVGSMNPEILIKRLSKVGKHAEICGYEELKAERREAEIIAVTIEKDEQSNGCKQEQQHYSCDINIEKTKENTERKENKDSSYSITNNKDSRKENKDSSKSIANNTCGPPQCTKKENTPLPHPEVNFTVHPSMQPYSNIKTHPNCCYIAQPYAITVPYYAIPSYPASAPPTFVEEYHSFDKPSFQPPFLRPTVRVGDYFSDENTMGCHVM